MKYTADIINGKSHTEELSVKNIGEYELLIRDTDGGADVIVPLSRLYDEVIGLFPMYDWRYVVANTAKTIQVYKHLDDIYMVQDVDWGVTDAYEIPRYGKTCYYRQDGHRLLKVQSGKHTFEHANGVVTVTTIDGLRFIYNVYNFLVFLYLQHKIPIFQYDAICCSNRGGGAKVVVKFLHGKGHDAFFGKLCLEAVR